MVKAEKKSPCHYGGASTGLSKKKREQVKS